MDERTIHTNAGAIFAQRLSKLREDSKMSLDALSEVLGVSRPTLRGYEIGKALPDIEVLDRAARYFGVTLNYLIGWDTGKSRKTDKVMKKTGLSEQAAAMLLTLDDFKDDKSEDSISPAKALSLLLETDEMSQLLLAISNTLEINDFAFYGTPESERDEYGDIDYDKYTSIKFGGVAVNVNQMDVLYSSIGNWLARIIEGVRKGLIAERAKDGKEDK